MSHGPLQSHMMTSCHSVWVRPRCDPGHFSQVSVGFRESLDRSLSPRRFRSWLTGDAGISGRSSVNQGHADGDPDISRTEALQNRQSNASWIRPTMSQSACSRTGANISRQHFGLLLAICIALSCSQAEVAPLPVELSSLSPQLLGSFNSCSTSKFE